MRSDESVIQDTTKFSTAPREISIYQYAAAKEGIAPSLIVCLSPTLRVLLTLLP